MAVQQVSRQHVVSKVLLKRFAVPGRGSRGWEVLPFDLTRPQRDPKPKSIRSCGWVKDLVPFDSGSLEALWATIEDRAPAAFAAADNGTPFANPDHTETLRDLIRLHFVRSTRYVDIHDKAFIEAYKNVRSNLVRHRSEMVRAAGLRETGLHLIGPQGIEGFVDRAMQRSEVTQDYATRKLLRASIERMFGSIRSKSAGWELEVVAAESGEFLIGDSPAVALHFEDGIPRQVTALGDAHTVILPVSPRHMLAFTSAPTIATITRDRVDEFNVLQVLAADRYVYFRPGSGLEHFVRATGVRRTITAGGVGQ